jgi:hypothetical protein
MRSAWHRRCEPLLGRQPILPIVVLPTVCDLLASVVLCLGHYTTFTCPYCLAVFVSCHSASPRNSPSQAQMPRLQSGSIVPRLFELTRGTTLAFCTLRMVPLECRVGPRIPGEWARGPITCRLMSPASECSVYRCQLAFFRNEGRR